MQINKKEFDSIFAESCKNIGDDDFLKHNCRRISIIVKLLSIKFHEFPNYCNEKGNQSVVIITAGSTGIGKTTIISWLVSKNYIELRSFLIIDIKAAVKLVIESKYEDLECDHKVLSEAEIICEYCIHIAISLGKCIIIDGSSTNDVDLQLKTATKIKKLYNSKILLLHVSANVQVMKERIKQTHIPIEKEHQFEETLEVLYIITLLINININS